MSPILFARSPSFCLYQPLNAALRLFFQHKTKKAEKQGPGQNCNDK